MFFQVLNTINILFIIFMMFMTLWFVILFLFETKNLTRLSHFYCMSTSYYIRIIFILILHNPKVKVDLTRIFFNTILNGHVFKPSFSSLSFHCTHKQDQLVSSLNNHKKNMKIRTKEKQLDCNIRYRLFYT